MSQTQAVALRSRSRIHWLALLILVAVALALVTLALVREDRGEKASPTTSSKYAPGSVETGRPDESKIAAAIGGGVNPSGSGAAGRAERPDESTVATAIAGGR